MLEDALSKYLPLTINYFLTICLFVKLHVNSYREVRILQLAKFQALITLRNVASDQNIVHTVIPSRDESLMKNQEILRL